MPVPCSYEYPTKSGKALRAEFLPGKTEDAGGLTPAKDDNATWRELCRKEYLVFVGYSYQMGNSRNWEGESPTRLVKALVKVAAF